MSDFGRFIRSERVLNYVDENFQLFTKWLDDVNYPRSEQLRKRYLYDTLTSFFHIPTGKFDFYSPAFLTFFEIFVDFSGQNLKPIFLHLLIVENLDDGISLPFLSESPPNFGYDDEFISRVKKLDEASFLCGKFSFGKNPAAKYCIVGEIGEGSTKTYTLGTNESI